jgi:hypothetical protein
VSNTVKITLNDHLVLSFDGTEYELGAISEITFVRSDTQHERILNSDGSKTYRPVSNITKIELACSRVIQNPALEITASAMQGRPR